MLSFGDLLPDGLEEWLRVAMMALMVGAVCFFLGRCDGAGRERDRNDAARAKANVEAVTRDSAAKEAAADERIKDAAAVSAKEKELIDAIETVPDTMPDAVRVALGCQRLRAAGTDPATLPAVCRPSGGTEAGAAP